MPKHALVIGNGAYTQTAPLKNPVRDARAMRDRLQSIGFGVTTHEECRQIDFKLAISDFCARTAGAQIALFYYAGHGLQSAGENYLIPVDAEVKEERHIPIWGIALQEIVNAFDAARPRLALFILDACRNNPFDLPDDQATATSRAMRQSLPRGLVNPKIHIQTQSYIAFSTALGDEADDDSVFTRSLLEHMVTPNLPVEMLFKRAAKAVRDATNHRQKPWMNADIHDEFTLFAQADAPLPESGFGFTPRPDTFTLTLQPTPSDATITLLGHNTPYRNGMALPPGEYSVRVERTGYTPMEGSIKLYADLTVPVTLQKLPEVQPSNGGFAPTLQEPGTDTQPNKAPKSDQAQKDHGAFIEPAMLYIKPGSFEMGSDDGYSDEKPVHTVNIKKGFYLGKYEVTFAEYDKYCEATGKSKPDDEGWGRGNRPVINVSWEDATDYAKWLSQKTGKRYRLPSEAEWEYAARAGTTTKYSWGDDIGKNRANCDGCGSKWDNKQTAPVGSFAANPWGLYDIHGNVYEWCADWYTDSYSNTPRDGSENKNGNQQYRVLRGGSWYDTPNYLRSANRSRGRPSYRINYYGFRLARD